MNVEKVFSKGKEKVVRHILCELEQQDGNVPVDADSDTITIEHILPQSPGEGWDAFDDQDLEAMTFRLANMVLIRKKQNTQLGNKPWTEKGEILKQSEFGLTRAVAEENADWNPTRLLGRQAQLAKRAGAHWRMNQLSAVKRS